MRLFRGKPAKKVKKTRHPPPGSSPIRSVVFYLNRLSEKNPKGVSRPRAELLAEKIWELALEGNESCLKLVVERLDGKPPERVELTTEYTNAETADLVARARALTTLLDRPAVAPE